MKIEQMFGGMPSGAGENLTDNVVVNAEMQKDVEKEKIGEQLVKMGDQLMEKNNPKEQKPYHNIEHPMELYNRAEKMANIFGLSEERKLMTKIIISYHDAIIDTVAPPDYMPGVSAPQVLTAMVTRKRGAMEGDFSAGVNGNEARSAELCADAMIKSGVYNKKDIDTAKLGIQVTYPGVEGGPDWRGVLFDNEQDKEYYDNAIKNQKGFGEMVERLKQKGIVKGIKFFQPHLENALQKGEKVPEEVLIMAMSDLGGSGIISAEQFEKEGNAEGREVKSNIVNNMKNLLSQEGWVSERENVVRDIQSWFDAQVTFPVIQAIRFEKIVSLLKKNGQLDSGREAGLREMFSHFTENALGSLKRAEEAEDYRAGKIDDNGNIKTQAEKPDEMSVFKYMAKRMGYEA